MTLASEKVIRETNIYWDSKLVVEWMTGSKEQRSIGHESLQWAADLKSSFQSIHLHHIYREHNQYTDSLSKQTCSRILISFSFIISGWGWGNPSSKNDWYVKEKRYRYMLLCRLSCLCCFIKGNYDECFEKWCYYVKRILWCLLGNTYISLLF